MNKIFDKKAKIGLSVICSAVLLLAILIVANNLVGLLPQNATLLDASENKMYSVSATAKKSIASYGEDIKIYLLSAGGKASLDDTGIHLDAFLSRLAAYNSKIKYSVVDLYTSDGFLENRGIDSSTVTLNSIVVESELRHRYIDSSELFYYNIDGVGKVTQSEAQLYQMYYGLQATYCFDGEGLILNSLSYVTSTELPLAISLTGHGETALTATFTNGFTNAGIDTSSLETLALVPGSEMLIINNPTSDISAGEASVLSQYLDNGGKLLLITAPGTSGFTNLCSVLEKFGLSYEDGIIMDETQGSYYQYPYYLMPAASSHAATEGVAGATLLPFTHGIAITEVSGVEAGAILSTSGASYIIPTTATSTVKPEGQEEKSYNVGVIAENGAGGSVIWFSSQMFLDESVSSATGGGNFEYATAISKYMCGAKESESAATVPMTLVTETLTFTPGAMAITALLVVGIVPISTIIIGVVYCYKRKRK